MYPYDYISIDKHGNKLNVIHKDIEQKQEDFFDVMKWRISHDRSNIVIIVGEQGSGKSNTGLYITDICNRIYYDKQTTIEDNVFTNIKNFVIKMRTLKDCYILLEEVGVELNSKDWRQSTNRIFRDIIETFRIKHINLVMTLPNLCDLDKSTRYLSHFIMRMEFPSRATILRKKTNFLTDKIKFYPVWTFEDIPDMKLYNKELWDNYQLMHDNYLNKKNDEWIEDIKFSENQEKYKRNWFKRQNASEWA